jgi:hypothetical protein
MGLGERMRVMPSLTFDHLVARFSELLPAPVFFDMSLGGEDDRGVALFAEAYFSRATFERLDGDQVSIGLFDAMALPPCPAGRQCPAGHLTDHLTIWLSPARFMRAEDLGPDEEGALRIDVQLSGVVLEFGFPDYWHPE